MLLRSTVGPLRRPLSTVPPTLSKSRIMTYQRCPRQFEQRYMKRAKRTTPIDVSEMTGSALHKAVEVVSKLRQKKRRVITADHEKAVVLKAVKSTWDASLFVDAAASQTAMAETVARVSPENIAVMLPPTPDGTGVLVEKQFRFAVDDVQFVGAWDRIERLEPTTPNGRPYDSVLYEFKSRMRSWPYLYDTHHRVQIDLYCEAIRRDTGALPVRVFLQEIGSSRSVLILPEASRIDETISEALTIAKRIERGDFAADPADPSICLRCPFRADCPSRLG